MAASSSNPGNTRATSSASPAFRMPSGRFRDCSLVRSACLHPRPSPRRLPPPRPPPLPPRPAPRIPDIRDSYGVALADFDQDGLLDVYLVGFRTLNRLLINNGDGTFRDKSIPAGVGGNLMPQGIRNLELGASAADFDNDGAVDLLICGWGEALDLLHNRKDGTFASVTRRAGIRRDADANMGLWGDLDERRLPRPPAHQRDRAGAPVPQRSRLALPSRGPGQPPASPPIPDRRAGCSGTSIWTATWTWPWRAGASPCASTSRPRPSGSGKSTSGSPSRPARAATPSCPATSTTTATRICSSPCGAAPTCCWSTRPIRTAPPATWPTGSPAAKPMGFLERPRALGLTDTLDSYGGAFADYDGDGDQDLFLTTRDTQPLLREHRRRVPAPGNWRRWARERVLHLQHRLHGRRSHARDPGTNCSSSPATAPAPSRTARRSRAGGSRSACTACRATAEGIGSWLMLWSRPGRRRARRLVSHPEPPGPRRRRLPEHLCRAPFLLPAGFRPWPTACGSASPAARSPCARWPRATP